ISVFRRLLWNARTRVTGNLRRSVCTPQEVCVTKRRCERLWGVRLALVLGVTLIVLKPAAAQSTIFNVPTTDTVAPKHGYFAFEYSPQIAGADGGDRFQTYTPRIVLGVVPNMEVGVNVSNFHVADQTFSLFQPNAKYKFYADDEEGLAAAAGFIWYIPI